MDIGSMIVLVDQHRSIYAAKYHIGVILCNMSPDPYFGGQQFLVLWCDGDADTYGSSILDGAWIPIE